MAKKFIEILKGAKVLLVEDNEDIRKTFFEILKLYFGEVYQACDGEEGLELFKKYRPHIVFSDVEMPKMTGLELTKSIREIDNLIPITIISAYSERDMLLEFMKLNLVEYIIKPIKHSDLITVLEKCAKHLESHSSLGIKLCDDCFFDRKNKIIIYKNISNALTTKEFMLLELLVLNKNKLVTKEMIEYELYESKPMGESSLRNLVFKLRKKMNPSLIKTVGTHGFSIED